MELKAYIHRTCPYSKKLTSLLDELNLLGFTSIIDTSENPFHAPAEKILSVPVLFADNNIISSGPVDESWLKRYLDLFTTTLPSEKELFRSFISAALDNISTASYLFLYPENFNLVMDNKDYFLSTSQLFRIIRKKNDEILKAVTLSVKNNLEPFLIDKEYLFLKVIGINYLREKFWLNKVVPLKEDISNENEIPFFTHWLYVRAATGRIGINHDHNKENTEKKARKVLDYTMEHWDELIELVPKTSTE